MLQDAQQLAAALIGTKNLPAGLKGIQSAAAEARGYHTLEPYPTYWFRDWKTEDRGPLPRCLPLAKAIVRRGARWLFGKPVQINVPANPTLEKFLRQAWQQNRMGARLVAIAENGALDGGVCLKFAYDRAATVPLSIQSLSLTDQTRLFYHPHDRTRLLMGRVQYSYYDGASGKTYWYREDWTDAEEVHYKPVEDEKISGMTKMDADAYEGWEVESREKNPFGLIPLVPIRNIETDDVWGTGDLWDLYRVLDRVHLTYHLMDRSNQFDSEINPIFIDGSLDSQDIDKPLQPGQAYDLRSDDGQQHQARVVLPEARGSLRPAMMEYARDLRKQVLDAASSVWVDQAEFSNKGNLTVAVLEQLYQPQIEITGEKRKSYGDDGIVLFLSCVAKGLSNLGVKLGVSSDPDTFTPALAWPAWFERSDDELAALTTRTQIQETARYLTHDRAVKRVAQSEGILDVEQLLEDLDKEPPPAPDPNVQVDDQENADLKKIGGKDSL